MSNEFSSVIERSNGQGLTNRVTAAWWNVLRTAGINLESKVSKPTLYTVDYTDLNDTAATTKAIEVFSLEQMEHIITVIRKHTTAFSGGSISALTTKMGISGDDDKYALDFDVFQAVGNTVFDFAQVNLGPENFGAATSIEATFDSVGDDLDALTSGALNIWIYTSTLPSS